MVAEIERRSGGKMRNQALTCGMLWVAIATVFVFTGCQIDSRSTGNGAPDTKAHQRAIRYLSREVAAWSRENGCFSCHNNGDGARALMSAGPNQEAIQEALKETIQWLNAPEKWDENKGDPSASDMQLADLQFAFAVLRASEAGFLSQFDILEKAARRVAKHQASDGSWQVEPQNPVGSPVTYGTHLATYIGWKILAVVPDDAALDKGRQKARAWLEEAKPRNIPGAAALLMFLVDSGGSTESRDRWVHFLVTNQLGNGGWGPYPQAPAEVFDTALAVIALRRANPRSDAVQKGRAYLEEQQRNDGSWAPTTRPTGGESYAQQTSTTAWATMAVLADR